MDSCVGLLEDLLHLASSRIKRANEKIATTSFNSRGRARKSAEKPRFDRPAEDLRTASRRPTGMRIKKGPPSTQKDRRKACYLQTVNGLASGCRRTRRSGGPAICLSPTLSRGCNRGCAYAQPWPSESCRLVLPWGVPDRCAAAWQAHPSRRRFGQTPCACH